MDIMQFQRLALLSQDTFITSLIHRPVVDSTNNLAIELANDSDVDGLVVIADKQTSGKGRRGNEWFSPEGNLYMSVVIKPNFTEDLIHSPHNLFQLITLMTAISVVEAIKNLLQINLSLKWPNDIMIEGKKVGGILIESRYKGALLNFVVIGIGLNLVHSNVPPSLEGKLAYLRQFTDQHIARDDILLYILKSLDRWYKKFRNHCFDEIIEQWKSNNCTLGRLVKISADERIITGLATDISNMGSLIIKDSNGKLFSIISGSLEFI